MKHNSEHFVFHEYNKHAVLHQYTGTDKIVTVPAVSPQGKPVTELGNNAFSFNRTLQIVIIPENCTTIGCGCFDGAYQLKCVHTELPAAAGPTRSVLPKNLRRIEYRAFSGTALSSIEFTTDDELEICEYAFSDCYRLTDISAPFTKSLILGDGTFMRSGITSFSAKLASTCVASYVFAYCSSLTAFSARYLNRLEDHAFYCCRTLSKIEPQNITGCDRSTFDGCTNLKPPPRATHFV